jgi:uncharacterized protein
MGRVLFWLLAALAAYLGFKRWQKRQRYAVGRDHNAPPAVESMVRCFVCGLNVPQSEAVSSGDRWFCGEEHRRHSGGSREA